VTDLDACFEGGVEPELITFLSENGNGIRDLAKVHAKVVVNDAAALIGSANFTKQGLGMRDEVGCLIREASLVLKLQRWFDDLFDVADPVDASRIASAAERGRKLAAARANVGPTDERRAQVASAAQRTLGWMIARTVRSTDESLTATFRPAIHELLKQQSPMKVDAICAHVRSRYPDLCEDSEMTPTTKDGHTEPVWRHRVRCANKDLQKEGLISYDAASRTWSRTDARSPKELNYAASSARRRRKANGTQGGP
jgi:hypothetical protein